MKFLTHLVMNDGQQGEGSGFKFMTQNLRYLEFLMPGETVEEALAALTAKPPPRLYTSHLPFRFLKSMVMEDKVKVINVMRNPKDTLVSFYHFYRMNKMLGNFEGSWDDFFFQLVQKKRLVYGDFFDYILQWWQMRHLDNILMVTYEEMQQDLAGVVRKVAKHLGKELTEEVVQKIVHLSGFNQMKDNPRVNAEDVNELGLMDFKKAKFLRKGEVGDWKNYFTEEQNKYIDTLCEDRCTPVGLSFEFDLPPKKKTM